jgi:hypothetical protein
MPSQFNGKVLLDNGMPLNRLNIEIDYPGRIGDRIITTTNNIGEWNITLDVDINPEDVTVRFYGPGYETKIVKNPQLTEVLKGFIDPIKGGTLDLTGKYENGKYQFTDLSNENQNLIYQEIKDIWKFVTDNYGNYTLTIDATETPTEKEDVNIQYQLPGLLAEARADEIKRILDNQFYQYLLDAKSKSGDREGFALLNTNGIPHEPKIELGSIDVVEGIKPGAKIKLSFIDPPKTNIPIINNETEFIQLLISNGFIRLATQEEIDNTLGKGSGNISKLEYIYWNKNENTLVFKPKFDPNILNARNIIQFQRKGILIPLTETITAYTNYSFTFDITNPKYEELKPQIQQSISNYIINIQKKSNLTKLDRESLIKKIEGISSSSVNVNPAYKETLQKIINNDIKSAKDVIETFSQGDRPELYNRLSKQRDIILSNGFSVDIIW